MFQESMAKRRLLQAPHQLRKNSACYDREARAATLNHTEEGRTRFLPYTILASAEIDDGGISPERTVWAPIAVVVTSVLTAPSAAPKTFEEAAAPPIAAAAAAPGAMALLNWSLFLLG